MTGTFKIRPAIRDDLPIMLDVQAASLRTLAASYYTHAAIEAFIAFGTMDPDLVTEGTFYVVEQDERIVATGGWSRRTPRYETQIAKSEGNAPARPVATVRSVFVHPSATRQGHASRLMQHIERGIMAAGFAESRLTATLSGVPLYRRLNWRSLEPITMILPGGFQMPGLTMMKPLKLPAVVAA